MLIKMEQDLFRVLEVSHVTPGNLRGFVRVKLRNIRNGTATGAGAGTLTGPDASGYYTATLTGVTIPANAVMVTGGLGYTYGLTTTQPLTQINIPEYPVAPNPSTSSVAPSNSLLMVRYGWA